MKKITLLLLFFTTTFFAQTQNTDSVRVDLRSPFTTIKTHLHFLQPQNYAPKKAAKTIYGLEEKKAVRKAIKIKQVLDGRGLLVELDKVPVSSNYTDSIGNQAFSKYVLFPERMPSIYLEKIDDKWYYSPETVTKIDGIYDEIYPWYIDNILEAIPDYGHSEIAGIELWQIVALLLLIVLVFIIYFISKKVVQFILGFIQKQITKNYASIELKAVVKKLGHPISLIIALQFLELFFPSLQFSIEVNKWFFISTQIAQTVFWIYVFLNLVKVVMSFYSTLTENTHNRLDDQLVPILNNLFVGIVLIVGAFRFLHIFGVNTTTLLAGATIGGLAFALASQDTVKNLIGTIMIFLDKPFHIDDWIEAGEVVGTVEKVGFRSTRVRAADTSIYQIPNSKLSEIVINNKGLRLYRRYNTNLGLRYDTPPELIQAFVNGVRQIIIEHPETRSDSYNVEFTGFGDSALLIMVNVYFRSLEWGVEQSSKHRLHMAIIKLAAALGVEFAFPSTTVTIEQFPDKQNLAPKYITEESQVKDATEKVLQDFRKSIAEENKNKN